MEDDRHPGGDGSLAGLCLCVLLLAATVALAAGTGASAAVTAGGAPAVAAGAEDGANGSTTLQSRSGIVRTDLSGSGVAVTQNNTTYVWQDGSVVVTATMFPLEEPGEHTLCLSLVASTTGEATDLACKQVTVRDHGTRDRFTVDELPTNETGPHVFELTLERGDRRDNASLPGYILTRGGDVDGDTLNNSAEVTHGTLITDPDTDSDTLDDGLELTKYDSYPKLADSDQDGLRDGEEVSRGTEAKIADTDGDGLDDGEEVERGTSPSKPDTDGDGLEDGREVELGTDPTSEDSDGDGLEDGREVELGTEPMVKDSDGDGIADGEEVQRGLDPLTVNTDVGTAAGDAPTFLQRYGMYVLGLAMLLVGIGAIAYATRRDDDQSVDRQVPTGLPTDGGTTAAEDPVDTDLLSPEQHVNHLLDREGGQMKQSAIVEATDWSKAKVSRTLSSMEDDGEVERVRIGRENVVTAADEEVADEVGDEVDEEV